MLVTSKGSANHVTEIKLSKNQYYWTFHIYTKELNPFGIVNQQGEYCFWFTLKSENGSLPWTIVEFTPENKEEKELLRQGKVLADTSKTYWPERCRLRGQFSQRVLLIKNNKEDAVSLPIYPKKK